MRIESSRKLLEAHIKLSNYLEENEQIHDDNIYSAMELINNVMASEFPEPNFVPSGELKGWVEASKKEVLLRRTV